jgi:hypothetical protein
MTWNRIVNIFGIDREHPKRSLLVSHEIDNAASAPFSSALHLTPEFPYSSGASNHHTSLRIPDQFKLNLPVFLVGEVITYQFGKQVGFNKTEHHELYGIAV